MRAFVWVVFKPLNKRVHPRNVCYCCCCCCCFSPNVFIAYYNRTLTFTRIIALHKFFMNSNVWSVFTKSVTTMQSQKLNPGLKVEATVELTPSSSYLEARWSSGHYLKLRIRTLPLRWFRCLVFKSSTKREIRHFRVVVVPWRQRNVQKSVIHVPSCCFTNLNLLLFWRSRYCRRRCCC